MPGLTERVEQRCVLPFYLKMMGLNALSHDVQLSALLDVARGTTDDEVAVLLASDWRQRVMGAWFASGRARRLKAALLDSLETSLGSLTAPPLAAVAMHGLGAESVPSLMAYLRRDIEHQLGSASFVAAAVERLDAVPASITIDDRARMAVDGMLNIVRRLAEAAPEISADPVN